MHHDIRNARATFRAAQTALAFSDWLRDGGNNLAASADLLGGKKWLNRADAVLAAVTDGVPLIELVAELSDLHKLLTLEFTDDLDSVEAALFLSIHPDDPRADEARLCAEALERGLAAIAVVAAADSAQNREAA